MAIRLSETGLDIEDPRLRGLFDDLQGNILKGHGRDHSRHIFVKFTGVPESCKAWLATFARSVTSASEQHRTARDFQETGTEHLFTGVLLTHSGYRNLGFDDDQIPDDKAFRAGMKDHEAVYDTGPTGAHARSLNPMNDDCSAWDEHFKERIDAMVVLAYGGANCSEHDASRVLDSRVEEFRAGVGDCGVVLSVQSGFALRNEQGHVIEHFGFDDGVSNPVFLSSDVEAAAKEGTDRYDSSAPVGLVLVQDPGGTSADDSFGTYFVYRKLQQNVKGFSDRVRDLASTLSRASGREVSEELAGALVVGRFKDGTPITVQDEPGLGPFNNFDYGNDPEGLRCPFHSHVRKNNPRGDTHRRSKVPLRSERSKRIVRRGISYGDRNLDQEHEWSNTGLLFLSCQSDIEQQFLVLQGGWSNNRDFVGPDTGVDPIIGQVTAGAADRPQRWPIDSGENGQRADFAFRDVVRCRGGEFFFAPSISFLRGLGGDPR